MTDFYAQTSDEQARRLTRMADAALAQWDGAFSDITLIKYRENAVFSAIRDDGRRVALRIHRHAYHDDEELISELTWMRALAAAGIDVPEAIPARDGRILVQISTDGIPEPRQVDMLGWLAGEPVGAIEAEVADASALAPIYHAAGALAARVHDLSSRWPLPPSFSRHAWDREGLIGEQPFWGRFWELAALTPAQVALLQRARARAADDLAAFGQGKDRYGLIHADFVPENLLRDGERLKLIDFDDAGFGWHMFEIATALYFHLDTPGYAALEAALVDGYRSVRRLDDEQLQRLPLFLLLRSLTYLGWVHTRSETETARELTPMFVERSCALAEAYLSATPKTSECAA